MAWPVRNNKRASNHWFRTGELASMHKNNMSDINPPRLLAQKKTKNTRPNLHSGREMQDHRWAEAQNKPFSHCPSVNTLMAVGNEINE